MLRSKLGRQIVDLLCRTSQKPRVAIYALLSNNRIEGTTCRFQPIQAAGRGRISFAKDVKIGVFPSPFFFSTCTDIEARNVSASVSIGAGTWINNNFSAIADFTSITIGCNCLVGASVEILDSDFHEIKVEERGLSKPEWARAVVIGDHVFLGPNVKIMKGVPIGNGSVIAKGAIVTKDIPAGAIAGGNPAEVLKVIEYSG